MCIGKPEFVITYKCIKSVVSLTILINEIYKN